LSTFGAWQTGISKNKDDQLEEAFLKRTMMNFGILVLTGVVAAGCAPSASQLKKVLEENPDIVFSVIEKNPTAFFETVSKAQAQAQQAQQRQMAEEETKKREEEFANPKKPALAENRAYEGAKDAPITIVEYSDFECPFCRRGHATVSQLLKDYPGKIRVLFKNLPIERIHPNAMIASQYYEAIALQDAKKAADFKKGIFDSQQELSQRGEAFLKELARKVGANVARVQKDINSDEVKKRIAEDQAEAQQFQFSGTPGYLINGVSLRGAYPIEEFKEIIDRQLQAKN